MAEPQNKYGRIADEFGKIPAEEPVFILRGQDVLAPVAVENYANLLRAASVGVRQGGSIALGRYPRTGLEHIDRSEQLRRMADDVSNMAATMVAWQAARGSKLPD